MNSQCQRTGLDGILRKKPSLWGVVRGERDELQLLGLSDIFSVSRTNGVQCRAFHPRGRWQRGNHPICLWDQFLFLSWVCCQFSRRSTYLKPQTWEWKINISLFSISHQSDLTSKTLKNKSVLDCKWETINKWDGEDCLAGYFLLEEWLMCFRV